MVVVNVRWDLDDDHLLEADRWHTILKISEEAERVGYKSFGEPRRCDEARVLRCGT